MDGLRVLVAEDNKISQQMISLMLKPTGVECVVVEDGEEAIEALEQREFGLVILDQHMPVMTGEEALIAIRASGKSYADIPVIIATGDDLAGDADGAWSDEISQMIVHGSRAHVEVVFFHHPSRT
ncbi:MAG: response regulator, partial [Methyloligellaceae bacterium]